MKISLNTILIVSVLFIAVVLSTLLFRLYQRKTAQVAQNSVPAQTESGPTPGPETMKTIPFETATLNRVLITFGQFSPSQITINEGEKIQFEYVGPDVIKLNSNFPINDANGYMRPEEGIIRTFDKKGTYTASFEDTKLPGKLEVIVQ